MLIYQNSFKVPSVYTVRDKLNAMWEKKWRAWVKEIGCGERWWSNWAAEYDLVHDSFNAFIHMTFGWSSHVPTLVAWSRIDERYDCCSDSHGIVGRKMSTCSWFVGLNASDWLEYCSTKWGWKTFRIANHAILVSQPFRTILQTRIWPSWRCRQGSNQKRVQDLWTEWAHAKISREWAISRRTGGKLTNTPATTHHVNPFTFRLHVLQQLLQLPLQNSGNMRVNCSRSIRTRSRF